MIKYYKIFTFMIIILLSTSLISCEKKDVELYYKIIEMPRDVEYGILTKYSYVAKGELYIFEEVIKDKLKEESIFNNKADIESTVLIDNRLYIVARCSNSLGSKIKYVYGYFDINTLEFVIVDFFKTKDLNARLWNMNNYVLIECFDSCLVFDINNNQKVLSIELEKEWYFRFEYSAFVYLNNEGFVIYDANLNKYELIANVDRSSNYYPIYGDYIKYYDTEKNEIFINYKTLEIRDYAEFMESVNENYINSSVGKKEIFNYELYDYEDRVEITYNDVTYEFSNEYFKDKHEIVRNVESLCSTKVYIEYVLYYNDEIFVIIGNDDSFFGFYTPGRTIPLVFRFNIEEENFSYVGSSGQIYSEIIKMVPLE